MDMAKQCAMKMRPQAHLNGPAIELAKHCALMVHLLAHAKGQAMELGNQLCCYNASILAHKGGPTIELAKQHAVRSCVGAQGISAIELAKQ